MPRIPSGLDGGGSICRHFGADVAEKWPQTGGTTARTTVFAAAASFGNGTHAIRLNGLGGVWEHWARNSDGNASTSPKATWVGSTDGARQRNAYSGRRRSSHRFFSTRRHTCVSAPPNMSANSRKILRLSRSTHLQKWQRELPTRHSLAFRRSSRRQTRPRQTFANGIGSQCHLTPLHSPRAFWTYVDVDGEYMFEQPRPRLATLALLLIETPGTSALARERPLSVHSSGSLRDPTHAL